ncbi:uncharacterized protein B0T23DRAFT_400615 [Neurospora hispaniola]|uniref:Uncharacterized protein n=1 Tax=Neurospora hispaniola TaxID=588809 RepID=A0AAJ0IEL3_9PEZI|nr:hypothetical protein B0T23DRAFT_400615 [Neurospora hispaniola]
MSSSSSPELQPPPAPTTTRCPTGPVPFLEYPSPNTTSTSSNSSSNSSSNNTTRPKRYLLFFISGNPGLIDYYAPFFTHLRSLLNELESKSAASSSPGHQQPITFHIYGQNLIGFSDSDHAPFVPGSPDTEPFVLEEQISHLYDSLVSLNETEGPFDEIILAGHSVGSFLSLEILHRSLSSSQPSSLKLLPITTALLLFPTIHQMHLSPSGLRLSRIRSIPFLDQYTHVLAKSVVDLVPRFALRWITRNVLGMSEHGSEVTTRFLQSRDGIWQAIHLGKDEMGVIRDGEGRWGWWSSPISSTRGTSEQHESCNGDDLEEEVVAKEIEAVEEDWQRVADAQIRQEEHEHKQRKGQEHEEAKKLKFFLYFGQNDHWVADRYRDEFIERRKREGHTGKEGGTKIVIDEDRIPHAFCINHSEQVAEKVRVWIEEVVEG